MHKTGNTISNTSISLSVMALAKKTMIKQQKKNFAPNSAIIHSFKVLVKHFANKESLSKVWRCDIIHSMFNHNGIDMEISWKFKTKC